MRPFVGVGSELLALAGVAAAGYIIPRGLPFLLYVLITELLATYFVHCPAHYVAGGVLGIRFDGLKVGRTTLARALPQRFSTFAKLFPVVTLTTSKPSLARAGRRRAAAMYASGTVASVLSAFVVAGLVTPGASVPTVVVVWSIAIGYLLFDLVFSPRSGDLKRARVALSSSAGKSVQPKK